MAMSLSRRAAAEFIGTFWFVLGGCGSAVLAPASPISASASPESQWPSGSRC
jgi:glycerol uptake facilitator-like aquaporin